MCLNGLSIWLVLALPVVSGVAEEFNMWTRFIQESSQEQSLPDTLTISEGMKNPGLLKGLYSLMERDPILMQRRLHVGSTPPIIRPAHLSSPTKRELGKAPLAVCPQKSTWRRLAHAQNMNGTAVRVFQPVTARAGQQWFYVTECFHNANTTVPGLRNPNCLTCCRGIDHTRYSSRCSPNHGYIMALVSRPGNPVYDWEWVTIPVGCSCSLQTR